MNTYVYKISSVHLSTQEHSKPIYFNRNNLQIVKQHQQNNINKYELKPTPNINTRLIRKKEKFLKMKSQKLSELNIPASSSLHSNAQVSHKDSVQYLDNKFGNFHMSDFDSESQLSFQYPLQHAKLAFYESLLSRKASNLKSFQEVKEDLPRIYLETNPNTEFYESTYESFFTTPRRVKKKENRHVSIRHFANVPKNNVLPSRKDLVSKKNIEILEDESQIARSIAPKPILEKVEETPKNSPSEQSSACSQDKKNKSDFNSGSFRNQFTVSFPNLYSSVSANSKKTKESNFRHRDSISNVLSSKMSLIEKYNLDLKLDSSFKYTKLLNKRKKENSILNSIDLKFNHLNDESIFFESSQSSDNHSHVYGKPKSHDMLVLPNVLKSTTDNQTYVSNKSIDLLNYQNRRKNESLVIS